MVAVAFVALLGAGGALIYVTATDGPPAPVARAGPPGAPRLPGLSRLLALMAVVAVPVTSVAYFTSTSGFYWDDLINFRQAQVRGLSLRYLLAATSAHFAPGHRLGDWVVQTFFPMNFRAAQILMAAGFAVSVVMLHRLLAELFGPGPGPLVLTFAYAASTIQVGTLAWWASGLDRLPATILTFASILGYVRFFKSGSRRALASSVVALVVALLFYVKPAFVPLYLVLIRVLLLQPDVPVRRAVAAAAREWRVWLLYGLPVAVYAVVYLSSYSTAEEPSVGLLAHYLGVSWSQVVAPAFFGLYIPKRTPHAVTAAAVVAVQAVLVAVVILSVRRRRGAWRAWAFFAVTFVANACVVGLTRVGRFGPKFVAYLLYYHLEPAYLACIAAGAIVLGVRNGPHHDHPRRRPAAPWLRPLVASAVATYVVLAWWGASELRHEYTWFGKPARRYMETADRELAAARTGREPVVLVNGTVPYRVVPDGTGYYNSHSEMLPLVDDRLSFDASRGQLFEVADDGTVRPVVFRGEAGGDAPGLLRAGSLYVAHAAPTPTDGGVCVKAGAEDAVVVYTPPVPLVGTGWHVALDVSRSAGGPVALVTEDPDDQPDLPGRAVLLKGGVPPVRQILPLKATLVRRVLLVLPGGTEVCLGRVEVGRLLPRAAAPL